MPFSGGGAGTGGGLALRVPADVFTGANIAACITARNTYFSNSANAAALAAFQEDQFLAIALDPTGADNTVFQTYATGEEGNAYDASNWLDRTGVIRGPAGADGQDGDDGDDGRDGVDGAGAAVAYRAAAHEGTTEFDPVESEADVDQVNIWYVVAGSGTSGALVGNENRLVRKNASDEFEFQTPVPESPYYLIADTAATGNIDDGVIGLLVWRNGLPRRLVEGYNNFSSGVLSHVEGGGNVASGEESHAEGSDNTASGAAAHAEGDHTTASGEHSHAEGHGTTASGRTAHAEGMDTIASGLASHASGELTTVNKRAAFVLGNQGVVGHPDTIFGIAAGSSNPSPTEQAGDEDVSLVVKAQRDGTLIATEVRVAADPSDEDGHPLTEHLPTWASIPAGHSIRAGAVVLDAGMAYVALTTHDKGTFIPSLDATNWLILSNWQGTWQDTDYPAGTVVVRREGGDNANPLVLYVSLNQIIQGLNVLPESSPNDWMGLAIAGHTHDEYATEDFVNARETVNAAAGPVTYAEYSVITSGISVPSENQSTYVGVQTLATGADLANIGDDLARDADNIRYRLSAGTWTIYTFLELDSARNNRSNLEAILSTDGTLANAVKGARLMVGYQRNDPDLNDTVHYVEFTFTLTAVTTVGVYVKVHGSESNNRNETINNGYQRVELRSGVRGEGASGLRVGYSATAFGTDPSIADLLAAITAAAEGQTTQVDLGQVQVEFTGESLASSYNRIYINDEWIPTAFKYRRSDDTFPIVTDSDLSFVKAIQFQGRTWDVYEADTAVPLLAGTNVLELTMVRRVLDEVEDFAQTSTPSVRFPESRYNLRDGQVVFGIDRAFTAVGTFPAENTWRVQQGQLARLILKYDTPANASAFLMRYPTGFSNPIRVGSAVYTAGGQSANGTLTDIDITAGGTGYSNNPTISFAGGGGTAPTAQAVVSGGVITGVNILTVGSGYSRTLVTISGGDGTGAVAKAVLAADSTIASIEVVAGGSGYTSAPTVTISGGNGAGATATATLSGDAVDSITVTAPGAGYGPVIAITDATGTGATAQAVIGVDTEIYIDLNQNVPSGYAGTTLSVRAASELVSLERIPSVAGTGGSSGQQAPAPTPEVRRHPQTIIVLAKIADSALVNGFPIGPNVTFSDDDGPNLLQARGWSFPSAGIPTGSDPLWRGEAQATYSGGFWNVSTFLFTRLDAGMLLFATNESGANANTVLQSNSTHFATRRANGGLSDWAPLGQPPVNRTALFTAQVPYSSTNQTVQHSNIAPKNVLVIPTTISFDMDDYTHLEFRWLSYRSDNTTVTYAPPRVSIPTTQISVRPSNVASTVTVDEFNLATTRGDRFVKLVFGGPNNVSEVSVVSAGALQVTTGYDSSTFVIPGVTVSENSSAVIDFSPRRAATDSDVNSRTVTNILFHPGSFGNGRLDIWGLA